MHSEATPLKNPLGARFRRSWATKVTGFGAFPSSILGCYQFNADIFNTLVVSPKFLGVALQCSRP
jgi:hypothetical protein